MTRTALDAAEGNGFYALFVVVRIQRWKMIARGEIEPFEGERMPPQHLLAELAREGES